MSDPRTEAAARAVHTYLYESAWAEASDWQLARCRNEAATVLAAADEVDRQAGIVRVKLDDEMHARLAVALHNQACGCDEGTVQPDPGDPQYWDAARAVLSVLRQSVEGQP